MTSLVNPNNIDGTFPVAGQDNSSQGFRDNFTNIKNNFTFLKSEIEDLQAKAVLKSALLNDTLNNDLSALGTTLNNAQLTSYAITFTDNGSISGAQSIDYDSGNFQKLTLSGSTSITITNWPTNGVGGELLLWINCPSTAYLLTLPAQVTLGFPNELSGSNSNVITFDAAGDYLYRFISTDGGTSYFCQELTRAPNKVHGNLNVTGTLTAANTVSAGTKIDSGYQFSAPSNHFNITVNNNVSRLILDPATSLTNGTVTLPSANVDATVVTISSTQAITNFQIKPNTGTTLVPSANVTQAGGNGATFFFHASQSKWYKIN